MNTRVERPVPLGSLPRMRSLYAYLARICVLSLDLGLARAYRLYDPEMSMVWLLQDEVHLGDVPCNGAKVYF